MLKIVRKFQPVKNNNFKNIQIYTENSINISPISKTFQIYLPAGIDEPQAVSICLTLLRLKTNIPFTMDCKSLEGSQKFFLLNFLFEQKIFDRTIGHGQKQLLAFFYLCCFLSKKYMTGKCWF